MADHFGEVETAMRTPHTHYRKGKTLWIRLRNGNTLVGKFVERKGRFVILNCGKFLVKDISAITFRNLGKEPVAAS